MNRIIRNAFRCKKCGQIVESKRIHDFVTCKCGNSTDGGHDYIMRSGNWQDMEDLSEYDDNISLCRGCWCMTRTNKKNNTCLKCGAKKGEQDEG